MNEVISRKAAAATGRSTYFTGMPCKHGHVDIRSVRYSYCFECHRISALTAINKDGYRLKKQAYDALYKSLPENLPKIQEQLERRIKKIASSDEVRETRRINFKRWVSMNRKAMTAHTRSREHRIKLATLKSVGTDEIDRMKDSCPENFVTDHIFPLHGKTVCGLHVPWNIQYLTRSENSHKRNKMPVGVSPLAFPSGQGLLVALACEVGA